jgi:flagellar FliL protein
MAVEKVEKVEKAENKIAGEQDTKKRTTRKVIILISILVIFIGLALGGYLVWSKYIVPAIGIGGEISKVEKRVEPKNEIGTMFPLQPFIVNLADSSGKRFLKITMELELSDEALGEEMKVRLPQIKDSILLLLSSKDFDDIYTVGGKIKLREEIIIRVNTFLKHGIVKNVYFTEFVIQ